MLLMDFFCLVIEETHVNSFHLVDGFFQDQKIYVQHRIEEESRLLWQLIHHQAACIYVAG